MRILHRNKTRIITSHFSSTYIRQMWRVVAFLFSLSAIWGSDVYAADNQQKAVLPPILDALTLVEERTQQHSFTPLTLSALKKINGEWVAEQEQLVEGQTLLKAFELSSPFSITSVKEAFKQFYNANDSQLIFKCLGFDCGSSNAWANERFLIKQLYGLDANQHMFVWQLSSPRAFDVVYMVQRGNRRQYALWQRIVPKDQTLSFQPGSTIYLEILNSGEAIRIDNIQLSEKKVNFDNDLVKSVALALNEEPFRSFSLNVQAQSEDQAKDILVAFESALAAAGIRSRRIKRADGESVINKSLSPAIDISWF